MRIHELKCESDYFTKISEGSKKAEWRRNDRGFEVGDILILREFYPHINLLGSRYIVALVKDITAELRFGIPEGYCMMSIDVIHKGVK